MGKKKTWLINELTKRRYLLNGILPDDRDPSKEALRQSFSDHVIYAPSALPRKADLRPQMTPVEDQTGLGSCTANAFAGAYEYLLKKATGDDQDVSRLFLYYNGRRTQGDNPIEGGGTHPWAIIESLEKDGVCPEDMWPYAVERVDDRPSELCYSAAQNFHITEAMKVKIDLIEMKTCIAQGFPFVFGLLLYKSFDEAYERGIVPMPSEMEQGRTTHSSHAMLAVGFCDASQCFIVRNSWGLTFRDKGYCYIPYEYLSNSRYAFDAWAIKAVESDCLGKGHWTKDDDDEEKHDDVPHAEEFTEGGEGEAEIMEEDEDDDEEEDDNEASGDNS